MKTSVNSSQFLVASDWWLLQGVLRRSLGHFGAIDWQTGGPLTAWDFEVEFWLHNTHHDSKFWESQPTQPCRIYVTKVSPGVCCLISKHLHSIPSFGFSLKVSSPKGKHYHTLSYRRQLDHRWQSRQTNLCQRKASLGDMWFTGLHSRKIKNIEWHRSKLADEFCFIHCPDISRQQPCFDLAYQRCFHHLPSKFKQLRSDVNDATSQGERSTGARLPHH